jgi:purine-binding chemotaxis protein CheW
VAPAVDDVLGVRRIDDRHPSQVPPLLAGASVHLVAGIATLDAELLVILQSAKLVPEAAWAAIGSGPELNRCEARRSG